MIYKRLVITLALISVDREYNNIGHACTEHLTRIWNPSWLCLNEAEMLHMRHNREGGLCFSLRVYSDLTFAYRVCLGWFGLMLSGEDSMDPWILTQVMSYKQYIKFGQRQCEQCCLRDFAMIDVSLIACQHIRSQVSKARPVSTQVVHAQQVRQCLAAGLSERHANVPWTCTLQLATTFCNVECTIELDVRACAQTSVQPRMLSDLLTIQQSLSTH